MTDSAVLKHRVGCCVPACLGQGRASSSGKQSFLHSAGLCVLRSSTGGVTRNVQHGVKLKHNGTLFGQFQSKRLGSVFGFQGRARRPSRFPLLCHTDAGPRLFQFGMSQHWFGKDTMWLCGFCFKGRACSGRSIRVARAVARLSCEEYAASGLQVTLGSSDCSSHSFETTHVELFCHYI